MVSKENSNVYVATVGQSREERMWNKASQVESILKDLEEKKDQITELHLSNNSIGLEVSEALAEKISKLKNLTYAGFNDIYVSRLREEIPKSLSYFISAIQDKNITVLDLSDNAFGPIGVKAIDSYLKTCTTIKELYIQNCGLGPEGASLLAEALKENKNLKLERIKIGRNRLENKGASAFAEYFAQTDSLKEVVAFQNGIKDEGMVDFLNGLAHNKNLEILKLNDNIPSENAHKSLVTLIPKLEKLQILDVSDSKLGCESSVELFESISKLKNIKEVYCNYNEIEEKDAQNEIVNILSKMEVKLEKLEIKGNEIKKSVFKKIKGCEKLQDTEVYSESEMDEDELADLMSGLSIKK